MRPLGEATAVSCTAAGLGILDMEVKEFRIGRTFIWGELRACNDRPVIYGVEGARIREEWHR